MNKTAKNSIIYLSGTVVMGLLGFVNTMLLTRILSRQVYAMYGLLTTFVTAADMLVAFGYDQAYMRFYYSHDRSPRGFLWQCLKVPLCLFALLALVLLEPGQYLIRYIFEDKLSFLAVLAIVGQIFFTGIHRFTQLSARMSESAGNYVLSNLIAKSGFIVLLFGAWLVLEEIAFAWVVLSFVVTAAAAAAVNLAVFRKVGSRRNPEGAPVAHAELLRYGFPYMINNVIILLIPVLEKVIIRDLAGWEVLSIFTAASIFQTVVAMLNNTLINIWNPIVYKQYGDEAAFKPLLHSFGLLATAILALGTGLVILLRRWLVLLLDADYNSVYIIAPAILLAACLNILSTVYSVGINIRKKTVHLIIGPVLQIAVSLSLCYLLIPPLGLTGVGLAVLCSTAVSRTYRILVGLHYYNTGRREWKTLLVCVLCGAAAVAAMFRTDLADDVLLSAALLIAVCLVLNKELPEACRTALRLIRKKPQT